MRVDEETDGLSTDDAEVLTEPARASESSVAADSQSRSQRVLSRARQSTAATAASVVALRIAVGLAISRAAISIIDVRGTSPRNGLSPKSLVGSFLHWDSVFFLRVAQRGYDRSFAEGPSAYPVYPLLTRLTYRTTGLSAPRAALVVNWSAFFLATWAIMELARWLWPKSQWYRCGALFAWLPASVFLLAGYSEPTFIALVAWSLVHMMKGRWLVAAALAGVASAARPEGAIVGVVLVVYVLAQRRYWHAAVTAVVSELGTIAVTVFFAERYHHFLAQFSVQNDHWHRHFSWPFHPVVWSLTNIVRGRPVAVPSLESNTVAVFLLNDALIITAVGVTAWLVYTACQRDRRLWPLAFFTVLYVGTIVSNGPFGKTPESADRLLMCVVPLYLVPAVIRSERVWTGVIALSAGVAIACQVLFNLGFWFT
jgi:mannosyltransferase PIG-V